MPIQSEGSASSRPEPHKSLEDYLDGTWKDAIAHLDFALMAGGLGDLDLKLQEGGFAKIDGLRGLRPDIADRADRFYGVDDLKAALSKTAGNDSVLNELEKDAAKGILEWVETAKGDGSDAEEAKRMLKDSGFRFNNEYKQWEHHYTTEEDKEEDRIEAAGAHGG